MTISRDDGILGGEPRIDGSRVAVRHVAARVIDAGHSPAHVADQFDLSLSSVYAALSYYYDNLDEIRTLERENDAAFERVRESSLKPKDTVQ
jgi:uncharacterized protein (DUF433 family)